MQSNHKEVPMAALVIVLMLLFAAPELGAIVNGDECAKTIPNPPTFSRCQHILPNKASKS